MKQVWMVKFMNVEGTEKIASVYTSEEHAEKETQTDKFKDKHVWVDGPYDVND